MRRLLIALAALILPCAPVLATPLLSFAMAGLTVPCLAGSDQLMPIDGYGAIKWPPAIPGAGPVPVGNFSIRVIAITHWIDGPTMSGSYAVVGHSGAHGDHISPMFVGQNTQVIYYPADAPVDFDAGDYLDTHAACQSGTHHVEVTVWYTQP